MPIRLSHWQSRLHTWIQRLGLLWGSIINGFFVGYAGCGDSIPAIAQANHVLHWLLLPNMALFGIISLFSRKWLPLLWQLPGIVVFAAKFGPLLLPRTAPNVDGVEIKAVTFNVLGHAANPEQTFTLIDAIDADIVAVQELRPGLRDMVQHDLATRYPYQATHINRIAGLGLFSRYPFLEEPQFSYDLSLYKDDYTSARYIRAVIEIEAQAVVVYVYHPPPPSFELLRAYDDKANQAQTRELARLIKAEVLPVILLCDCNATPYGKQYNTLDGVLNDAFAQRGWGLGLTFPAKFPLIRIDYVWHTNQIVAVDARVWVEDIHSTSDHLPVLARLVLPDQ
jgi:vancomycin resistance protein VanJ